MNKHKHDKHHDKIDDKHKKNPENICITCSKSPSLCMCPKDLRAGELQTKLANTD